jgi:hypothetical protein
MSKVVQIKRTKPRSGGDEYAIKTPRGYQLRDPELSRRGMNKVANATFVPTLDDAVTLLAKGYDLRMGRRGVQASYICLRNLEIIRV